MHKTENIQSPRQALPVMLEQDELCLNKQRCLVDMVVLVLRYLIQSATVNIEHSIIIA